MIKEKNIQSSEKEEGYKKTKLGWIPKEWEVKKVKNFGKVITGNTPSTKRKEYYGGKYLFVSPSDMSTHKYIEKTDKTLTKSGFETGRIIKKGSALFVSIGSTIGKTGLAKKDLITNQQINSIVPNEKSDGEFLYYQLTYNAKRFSNIAGNQAVPILNKTTFENIELIYPPFPEQQKIATILSKWDNAIDKLTQLIAAKELQKKGLMQQLLTGELRFPGFEDEWETVKLGEVGKVRMCKRVFNSETKAKGDIPFYKISTFGKTADAFISEDLYNKYRAKFSFPNKGDVLISAAGTLGKTVVYDGSPAYFQDSNIVWIGHDETVALNSFLYYVYQIIRYDSEGGTVKRLYNSIILNAKFLLPTIPEQQKIASMLSATDKEIEILKKQLTSLQEQKKGLMQVLLTGEVRVKNET